ncbi:TadE/TadG family type IV pilus assembly protein [Hyphomicrobium sp.]|jgi:Flp pilus assembly protein TadG|uniref:TadE/TadG family type IV pilus assembly protein n=1 Tax=Hyphomicrobium sp. TaxID=82 RepID=UPI0035675EBD
MRLLWTSSIAARFRIFRTDVAGVAAIEFAFLVPVLLVMTFGTIEMSRAVIVHKRFQRATAMVGDLVSREKDLWPEDKAIASVTTADAKSALAGIMLSAEHVLDPYSVDTLQIRVYQAWANVSTPTQAKIEWSYEYTFHTKSAATVGCGDKITLDQDVLSGNGRAIVVEGTYTYTPILVNLLPSIISQSATWFDRMRMTPRDSPSVLYLPALNNNNTWDSPSLVPCQ